MAGKNDQRPASEQDDLSQLLQIRRDKLAELQKALDMT